MNIEENDYLSFYYAGLNIIRNLPNLYNSSLSPFPFRYLPPSAYFFTPFSILGLELGYFFFQIFNFFLNVLLIYLMYRIIQIYNKIGNDSHFYFKLNKFRDIFDETDNDSILHQNAVFLIMLPQFMNYFLGQINLIVLFFILSSLLYFLKGDIKNDIIGGFLIGLGLLLKPNLILILPFLFVLNYNRKSKKIVFNLKKTIARVLGPLILIFISGIYFFIYPQMLSDFIAVNLTGEYTYTTETGIEINPSFSLTRIVLIFLQLIRVDVNGFLVFIGITLIILIPIYFFYIQTPYHPKNLINGYLIGILVMLIVYFDSWPHHLVVLTPFLIFFILFNKKFQYYKLFKYIHYLVAILMVIFWGIYYITHQFFPFNAGGLTLLMLLYYCLITYYLNQVRENL
ncbi:MAG: glycosyltransferase 87 family protein [Candidatus Hodarchaeota archaeon]